MSTVATNTQTTRSAVIRSGIPVVAASASYATHDTPSLLAYLITENRRRSHR